MNTGGAVLVVGLGNPGKEYRETRHNAGLMAVRKLRSESELGSRGKFHGGKLCAVRNGEHRFLVLEPDVFMNVSGSAVAPVVGHYRLHAEQLVVIHDDIDIPFGEVRVKRGGGTGGHRGLASLKETLGDGEFARVRVGVGRPPAGVDAADYVLAGFSEDEQEELEVVLERAVRETLRLVAEVAGEAS